MLCYNLKKYTWIIIYMIICFCSRLWLIRSSLYACVHRCIVSFFYNNKLKTTTKYATLIGPIITLKKIMCRFQKNHLVVSFFLSFPFLFPYCVPALRLLHLVTKTKTYGLFQLLACPPG